LMDDDVEKGIQILREMESLFVEGSIEVSIIRAFNALIQSDVDRCLGVLDGLLHTNPDLAIAWHLKAIAFDFSSRYEDEIIALRRKIELSPDAESWHQLGEALSALDRDEEAVVAYDETLRLQPESFDAIYEKSLSLWKLSRTSEALSSIDQAITLQPESADSWHLRGELLDEIGEIERALNSVNKAIALRPNTYQFLFSKAWCLAEMRKTEEALQIIDQLLELDHNSSDSYFLRGLLLVSSDFDKGFMNLKRAFSSGSERSVVDTAGARLLKIFFSLLNNELREIQEDWTTYLDLSRAELEETRWLENASHALRFMVLTGHLTL